MKRPLILLALSLMAPAAAKADAIYTLQNQVYNQEAITDRATVAVTFTLTDAAVARGSTNFTLAGSTAIQITTGTYQDLVSATESFDGPFLTSTITQTQVNYSHLDLAATFDPAGNITVSNIDFYSGATGTYDNGTFVSETDHCVSCTVTGQFVRSQAVPEPTSVALMGAGLLGLAAVRRRVG